jgi:hypothetical protein
MATRRAPLEFRKALPKTATAPSARRERGGAREGTHLVGAHVPRATYQALRVLAAERGVTMQALVTEALDDVQSKYRAR